jgi:hypothetical protein
VRPTAEEILKGIKYTLEEVVAPDLRSPWPKWMAEQMGYFLDHLVLRDEKELEVLKDENEDLQEILLEAEAGFREMGEIPYKRDLRRLAEEIGDLIKADPGDLTIPQMRETNNVLRGKVCVIIELVDKIQEKEESSLLSALRKKIQGYIKRQAKREAPFMHSLFGVKRATS